MADVRLDGLFREEEPLADLAVDESVRDELQHLDLARRRLLLELAENRRREGDHGTGAARAASCGGCLEAPAVVPIPAQDLLALCSVHARGIGLGGMPL